MTENNIFHENPHILVELHENDGMVDFHENSGFLLLSLAPAPNPTKKHAISIGFEPPRGAKSANFTHFHENHPFSPILMEFHQN